MGAMLDKVIPLNLPKKPRIKLHESPPDQRRLCVVPIRACTDKQITLGMMRTFVLICSYMNRSGITWVSQNTLASKLGISQQGISKHLIKLVKAGYLEVMRKPRPGERTTTWRVIFDPNVSAQDAISLVSTIEDTRPPWMKEEQSSDPDPAGQKRIADLVANNAGPDMPADKKTALAKDMASAPAEAMLPLWSDLLRWTPAAAFSELRCPIHAINGDLVGDAAKARCAGHVTEWLQPGTWHFPQMEQPEIFADVFAKVLEQI